MCSVTTIGSTFFDRFLLWELENVRHVGCVFSRLSVRKPIVMNASETASLV